MLKRNYPWQQNLKTRLHPIPNRTVLSVLIRWFPALTARPYSQTQYAKKPHSTSITIQCQSVSDPYDAFSSLTATVTNQPLPSFLWKIFWSTLYHTFPQTLPLFYLKAKLYSSGRSMRARKYMLFFNQVSSRASVITFSCRTSENTKFLACSSSISSFNTLLSVHSSCSWIVVETLHND